MTAEPARDVGRRAQEFLHGAWKLERPMLAGQGDYLPLLAARLAEFGLWLGPRTREEPARGRFPAASIAGSALGGPTLAAATGGFPLTWVMAGHYAPMFSQSALLADTALWTFVALCGCLTARVLMPLTGRRRRAVESVRPADGEA